MSDKVTPLRVSQTPDNTLRAPPHNYEAERALLGAILMNNRAFDRVSDFLMPEHFGDPAHARVYEICTSLVNKNQPVNPVALKGAFDSDPLLQDAGGMKYLAALAASAVTVINAGEYGRLIYDLFLRRELIAVGEDMINAAFDASPDQSALAQIEESSGRLADLASAEFDTTAISLQDAVQMAMRRWEQHDKGEIAGLSTGIDALDRELGLLEDGDLCVLSGAQGSGKTALAFNIAMNAARKFREDAIASGTKPKRVLVFSAEMGAVQLAERALTTATGIQGPRQRRYALQDSHWGKIMDFASGLEGLPLMLDSRSSPSTAYIRSRCRQEQRKGLIGLIVVDFLQIMAGARGARYESQTVEVGNNAKGMKAIARDMRAPAIILSSLNRGVDAREDKRPHMSDLRASGEIEFAADQIAFTYREEYYLERSEPADGDLKARSDWNVKMAKCKDRGEVIVAKQRHGSTGTAELAFDRTRTLWSDLPREQEGPPLESYQEGLKF